MGEGEVKKSVTPVLGLSAGRPVCTSLAVAQHFEKRHDHVLRDINNLLVELPESHRPNFGEISIPDSYGRKQPAYEMTRDGFSLLVMGFTGKKALKWKLKYIDAFNLMEQELVRMRQAQAGLPSKEQVKAAMDHHMFLLGRSSLEPDHPMAQTWRKQGREFIEYCLKN